MNHAHYYTVTTPAGETFIDAGLKTNGTICYASYNAAYQRQVIKPFKDNKIHLFISKTWGDKISGQNEHATISQENLTYIIESFVKSGFPVSYVNQDEDCYIICLNESDYHNRSHLRVFLDFFRVFWEGGTNCIGFKYLSVPEEIRNQYDFLFLIQICYQAVMITGGHGLSCGTFKYNCHTSKEIIDYLKDKPQDYNDNLGQFWNTIRAKKKDGVYIDTSVKKKIMFLDFAQKENIDKVVSYMNGETVEF